MQLPRELPEFETHELAPRRTRYCMLIVVWNEGDRLRGQLDRLQPYSDQIDIVIADSYSSDGSTDLDYLRSRNVRALVQTRELGLCTATRMGLGYGLDEGYEGIVTVDGNGKDGVEATPRFIEALDEGYDLVQGSRFMEGGVNANTPLDRYIGVRYIFAPILSIASGVRYTDPTNAFRAISRRLLEDPGCQPLRKEFVRFNLQMYLIYCAGRLGLRAKEIPVVRVYPESGTVPTKIVSLRTKLLVVWEMLQVAFGVYNPKSR